MQFLSKATVSQSEYLKVAFVLVSLICIAFANVIFQGKTLTSSSLCPTTMPYGAYGYSGNGVTAPPFIDPGASGWIVEPQTVLIHRLYFKAILPLWNPHNAMGCPLAANMEAKPFFPLKILLYFSPNPYTWDFYLLLRLFLAGLFSYLWMRKLGLSKMSSIGGSITWMLNGYFMLYLNMHQLDAEILLPLLLYGLEILFRSPRWKSIFLCGFLVGFLTLAGLPRSTFFALFFATLYFSFRVFQLAQWKMNVISMKYLCLWILILLIGFGLTAFHIIPFIEYFYHARTAYSASDGFGLYPWETSLYPVGLEHSPWYSAISLMIPYFFGNIHQTWNNLSDFKILPYTGIIPLFLSLLSLSERGKQKQFFLFFSLFALFYLLKAYGCVAVNWVGRLPFFNLNLFPKYLFPEFALSIAFLAGLGIEGISNGKITTRKVLCACGTILGIILFFVFYHFGEIQENKVEKWILRQVLSSISFLIVALCLLLYSTRKKGRFFSLMIVLILTIELFSHIPKDRPQRYDSYQNPPPYIQYLLEKEKPYRILGLDKVLFPTTSAAFEIDDVRTTSALCVNRTVEFAEEFLGTVWWDVKQTAVGSDIVDLMNVKYVLTTSSLGDLAKNSNGKFNLIYDNEIKIYENNRVFPRAFVVNRVEVIKEKKKILERLGDEHFSLRRSIVIDEDIPSYMLELNQLPTITNSSLEFTHYQPNKVEIKASLNQKGFLVLTDTFFPGWKASIDGESTKIYRVDYMFRGIFLHEGDHRVTFVYDPLSWKIGLGVSLTTFLLIIVTKLTVKNVIPL